MSVQVQAGAVLAVALWRREHQPHGQPALQDRGGLHRTQVDTIVLLGQAVSNVHDSAHVQPKRAGAR